MKTRWSGVRTICALSALLAASSAFAQQDGKAPAEKTDEKATQKIDEKITEKAEEKQLPGPKYLNLRYDEDFSYLDGEPGSYRKTSSTRSRTSTSAMTGV
ncbi:MAG: hypothetical protein IIC02_01760 [Planctomycetes bacterium]|nr:hypothetical protein [Planctomycetota bacterium]